MGYAVVSTVFKVSVLCKVYDFQISIFHGYFFNQARIKYSRTGRKLEIWKVQLIESL